LTVAFRITNPPVEPALFGGDMRPRLALAPICSVLFFFAGSVLPVHGQEFGYTTLSAGWSAPAGGPVSDSHQPGFTLAASYRTPLEDQVLSGLEIGYTWLSLDRTGLADKNPGSTFSGGDLGMLSITSENDYLLGTPGSTMRPFVNLGLGFFRSYLDGATVTTNSVPAQYSTGVYEGSFFGFHTGIGVLIKRQRFGIRLDANYQYLFAGGPDLEFFPVRAGIIFYPKGAPPAE
jgi:hypothetical protein